tara:strand:+ start:1516 stop:1788 length:273 start_codon:yes stop_codon:yes gene_type:complete
MVYEVYGTISCRYCIKATKLLEEKEIPFEYIDLQNVPSELQVKLMNVAGHKFKIVPQIFIEQHDKRFENERVRKRTYIGGYTELKQYLGV